ncbi:uncharacterized protein LOC103708918 isoform X4 [Phoenix dactylifera]|uniref:Uncharacterized protein LOC103708918 isoform X4 n=1 Tax=Phoenix dactylifera TaxID=42345 RepID=A0A8B9AS32_PHODC|nr:uncharacterized protein LOC103708918 isoform X4 [Phoenix dactylifera]
MENPSKEKEKMMPPLPPPRRQIRPPPPRNREAGRQNFLAIYRRIDETFQCCVDGEAHPDYSDLSEMVHESLLHGDAKISSWLLEDYIVWSQIFKIIVGENKSQKHPYTFWQDEIAA